MVIDGKLYIGITSYVFHKSVWMWMKSFHDCYIFQSCLVQDALQEFDTTNVQMTVQDNNETGELDSCKTAIWLDKIHDTLEAFFGSLFTFENSMN